MEVPAGMGVPEDMEAPAGMATPAGIGAVHGRGRAAGRGHKAMRAVAAGLLVFTLGAGTVACGDDPGEDVIGDGEINDPGD